MKPTRCWFWLHSQLFCGTTYDRTDLGVYVRWSDEKGMRRAFLPFDPLFSPTLVRSLVDG